MSIKITMYVDGESHFHRSLREVQKKFGDCARLEQVRWCDELSYGESRYPLSTIPGSPRLLADPKLQFFWDTTYINMHSLVGERIQGCVYFTAFVGGVDEFHNALVSLREKGFEPRIVQELKKLAERRADLLKTQGVIEKPKGVDIGLTVRILEDASRDIYDMCYLFTSDVDYIPVIEAVQRLGKQVIVFGYKDGLGSRSKLEYVPDRFIDLSKRVNEDYELKREGQKP